MSTYNHPTGRLAPQSMLQQRYIILQAVGQGGMGAVYQALDTRTQRQVAIKEMSQAHFGPAELAQAQARFQQEAMMLAQLTHPNLPHIYNSFNEQGRSYLVMEFINGKTLFHLLRENNNKPMPVKHLLHYGTQLCDVLSYLHQQQPPIIFRDVKPTNIMVTTDGHVFLIDFGIARFFKEEQALDTVFLGSPGYAAPEQHGTEQSSPRTDIYGLGATLHYCLTGRDPYYAQPRFTFQPIRTYNPAVPAELDQLILHMVAHETQARPASMAEVAQTLRKIDALLTSQSPILASPSVTAPSRPVAPTQVAQPISNPGSIYLSTQAIAAPTSAGTPLPWMLPTLIRLIALLVMSIGISIVGLQLVASSGFGWGFLAASALALLHLILLVYGIKTADTTRVRIASPIAAIATLISGLAALALGSLDVQQLVAFLSPSLLNSIQTVGLIVTALAMLVWLRNHTRIELVSVGILNAIALISVLIQTFLGPVDLLHYILLLLAWVALIAGSALVIKPIDQKHI